MDAPTHAQLMTYSINESWLQGHQKMNVKEQRAETLRTLCKKPHVYKYLFQKTFIWMTFLRKKFYRFIQRISLKAELTVSHKIKDTVVNRSMRTGAVISFEKDARALPSKTTSDLIDLWWEKSEKLYNVRKSRVSRLRDLGIGRWMRRIVLSTWGWKRELHYRL